MPAESLKKIFNLFLHNSEYGCTWVKDNERYSVCYGCIMQQPAKAKEVPMASLGGKILHTGLQAHPEQAYPENVFFGTGVKIPVTFNDFVVVNRQLVSLNVGKTFDLPERFKPFCRHYKIKEPELLNFWKDNPPEVGVGKRQNILLKFTEGYSTLYISYKAEDNPDPIKVMLDGEEFTLHSWSDKEKQFKKIKKVKMPVDFKGINLGKTEVAKEVVNLEENMDVEMVDIIRQVNERADSAPEVKEEVKATSDSTNLSKHLPKVEDKVIELKLPDEVIEGIKEEPVKRTRRKAVKTKVQDLTEIIEQLGGDIPENLSNDEVINELRQIRELIMTAARRSSNLSTFYLSKISKAAEALQQIKGLLQ